MGGFLRPVFHLFDVLGVLFEILDRKQFREAECAIGLSYTSKSTTKRILKETTLLV